MAEIIIKTLASIVLGVVGTVVGLAYRKLVDLAKELEDMRVHQVTRSDVDTLTKDLASVHEELAMIKSTQLTRSDISDIVEAVHKLEVDVTALKHTHLSRKDVEDIASTQVMLMTGVAKAQRGQD